MKRPALLILLLALALGSTPLLAQPAPPPPPGGPGGPPPPGPGPGNLGLVLRALDLNADQAAQVEVILKTRQMTAMEEQEALGTARRELDEQVRAQVFDEAALRSKAAAVAVFEARRVVADAAVLRDVRALLTEEQRAKFEQLLLPPPPPLPPHGGPKR